MEKTVGDILLAVVRTQDVFLKVSDLLMSLLVVLLAVATSTSIFI